MHFQGWRYHTQSADERAKYRRIVRFFADVQSPDSPFSIHNIVALGIDLGKNPGDWYGPASIAHILR